MKTVRVSHLIGLAAAVSVMLSGAATADWFNDSGGGVSAGEPQDVVIALKINPLTNPETACLAVTLARALSGSANVTLFPTLDGVALGDAKIVGNPKFKCTTPWGQLSLEEHLIAFLDENDYNMVVCPICWGERYGDVQPDYGFLPPPGSPAVGKMLLDADKVIDF